MRFLAARFEFALDEDLIEAARCEEMKNALAAKGSKERTGSEIDLMIRGNEPVKAMSYISDLTLYFVVFCLPPNVQPDVSVGCQRTYPMESFSSLKEYHPNFNQDSLLASNSFSSAYNGYSEYNFLTHSRQSIAYLDAVWSMINSIGYDSFTDQQRLLGLYAVLFLPFRKITKKETKMPAVNYILRNSLKQKAEDRKLVMKIHQSLDKFAAFFPSLTSKDKPIILKSIRNCNLLMYPPL
ncbi:hypothetical protein LINPERHAP1_LOCUS30923 [Linum perenne]